MRWGRYIVESTFEHIMKNKPFIETNPYLKNPDLRNKLISRSVDSSCRVEGIYPSDQIVVPNLKSRPKRLNLK